MPQVPIPYDPVNSVIIATEEFDGAKFKTASWKVPANVPYKGKLIYVHGFAEDCTVYTEFCDNLASNGIEVYIFEQRGAGEYSSGKLMGKTNEYHTFHDLDYFIKKNLDERQDKNEQFFLAGHSMGGAIVLHYGITGTYKDQIKGIVSCGPLITLNPNSQPNFVLKALMPFAAKVLPNHQIDTKLNYDYITSNEKWKDYIKKTTPAFIGTTKQMFDMLNRGEKLLDANYGTKFSGPLLMVHGKEDHINDIHSTEAFYKNLPDKTDKFFYPIDHGKHSLFLEVEPVFKNVLGKLLTFFDEYK